MKKIYLLSIITLLAFISSCKKDTSLGADILPKDDLLNVKFSDTFSLFSKTLTDTFLRSDKLAKNYLGVINDSKFGFQKASIVMELDKPNTVYDDTLNTSYTVDSVVLFLRYTSFYGDTTVPQSFDVSTISNKINETSLYYSNTTQFPASSYLGGLSNYYFTPNSNPVHLNRTDSVGITRVLRVKLNSSLGNTIIGLGQNTLRDSAAFKNAFPGIIIENSTSNGKGMAEVDINSSYSSIAIFYKDKYGASKDMRLYTSLLRNTSGILSSKPNGVNLFSNILSTDIQNTTASGLVSDSVNYILGQGGSLVRLSLPTLGNLGKIAVNKAVISVNQIQQNANSLAPPNYLILLKRNSAGNLDVLATSDGVGILDSTSIDNLGNKIVRYDFNITRYIQAISTGSEINSDLYITTYRSGGTDGTINALSTYSVFINGAAVPFSYTPSRMIIAGPNYSDARYKMKLNLTYTLIK